MEFINSLTPHQYFLLGGLVASLLGTIGITEWIKQRHYRIKAEKLWTGFIFLNVTVWSTLLTAADAITSNLSQVSHLGSLIPTISPFVSIWAPRVSIAALIVHTVATALLKWWKDREAKRPITNPNIPDLTPQVEALTAPVPVNSFGTEAANRQNVIQL